MRGGELVWMRRALLPAALLMAASVGAAWPGAAAAQDATPAGDAAASPVPIASPAARTVECAGVLGLEPGSACVLVVHASPDAPEVDVYLDGEAAIEGLAFGTASAFLAVPPGEHRVQVAAAGEPAEEAVIDATLAFEAGLAYELAAIGPLDAITAAVLSTNLDPLPDDRARIRVFQAIPGAPPAEVALAGGETVLSGIEYASATGYAEVPAGATPVDLEVRPAGAPVVIPIRGATLTPGTVYTFYVVGELTDPGSLRVVPVTAPAAESAGAGSQAPAASPIPLALGTPEAETATPEP